MGNLQDIQGEQGWMKDDERGKMRRRVLRGKLGRIGGSRCRTPSKACSERPSLPRREVHASLAHNASHLECNWGNHWVCSLGKGVWKLALIASGSLRRGIGVQGN